MGILNINDLKEGMTLAADVKNKHGNIMIRQGMILSDKHIMLLKAWGIPEADVEGADRDQLQRGGDEDGLARGHRGHRE